MELIRFYCNPIVRPVAQLSQAEAHHLRSVRRLKAGEKIEIFDGKGSLAKAAIKTVTKHKVILQVEEIKTIVETRGKIILAVSVAKGDRFDWLISKCTELGVDRICPVIFERTVKQADNPKTIDRWQNITIAAAKQCRRLFLPQIDSPALLTESIERLMKDYGNARILLGSLDPDSQSLMNFRFGDNNVIAVVGPEGGLTEKEEDFLQNSSAERVQITDTILRVETAALAFASILTAQRTAG